MNKGYESIAKEMGRILRVIRLGRGETIEDIANVLHITEDKYIQSEAGERELSNGNIILLSAHYRLRTIAFTPTLEWFKANKATLPKHIGEHFFLSDD